MNTGNSLSNSAHLHLDVWLAVAVSRAPAAGIAVAEALQAALAGWADAQADQLAAALLADTRQGRPELVSRPQVPAHVTSQHLI